MKLEITDAERRDLVEHLEAALSDKRVEIRRTATPDYHDQLLREKERLESLLAKLQSGMHARAGVES
jgi:hypothetical protein